MARTEFKAKNPEFEAQIRRSVALQPILTAMETELTICEPGFVEFIQPAVPMVIQQHGFVHGGVIGLLADISGGHASQSLGDVRDSILTIEYKINHMAPAIGEFVRSHGTVIRAGGRTLVARMELYASKDGAETLIAAGQGTYMRMVDRPDHESRVRLHGEGAGDGTVSDRRGVSPGQT